MISESMCRQLAQRLHACAAEKRETERITQSTPLSIADAYRVQEELVSLRLQSGERIVGPKMGLTSRAKMEQMKVEEPIYGYITDAMLRDGGVIRLDDYIHPKVEAEIAFVLGADLEGPELSVGQVLAAVRHVVPALEVIDSRYRDFSFTLPDVIADNASSSAVVLGTRYTAPPWPALELVGVTLSVNGELREVGAGAAVLGHPAQSVAKLAAMLHRQGLKLRAGQVILTGGMTGAVALTRGDVVHAAWDGLGTIAFRVE